MAKSTKIILTELLWLISAFVMTILICRFFFHLDLWKGNLDLHMHDTYLVIAAFHIFLPVFLLMIFVVYFIKEWRQRYSRTLPNVILFIAGIILILFFAFQNQMIIRLGMHVRGGWVMYPPLSAEPQVENGNAELDPAASVLTNSITLLQMIFTIALLYASFQWGRSVKRSRVQLV